LRRSEEKYRLVVESSLQGIVIFQNQRIVFVNPAMCQIMGYSAAELTSFSAEQILATVHPEDRAAAIERSRARGQGQLVSPHYEYRIVRRDGSVRCIETFTRPMVYENEAGSLSISLDITERKQLEEQLRQAQKLEAIGRLAGGIAHDFNNILTVIKGYTGLLLQDLDAHNPLTADIGQIEKSAERAAALTRQLLAFSRKQVLQPVVLDFNAIVSNMDKMLQRLIGEDIILTTLLDPALGQIKADPGQIEQVLLNLAANARDAMPQGGKLTIETKNIYLNKRYARQHLDVKAGPYIMLAMSDTGSGMDEETRSHMFEPFFTTKEQGKGTGLGLATVHGIVIQSGGHIGVSSEPGQGTTFKVYLPRAEGAYASAKPKLQSSILAKRGSETILLVEDEALVREFARRTLLNEGYLVLEASYGEEAIRVAQQHQGSIDLLVTDLVMPGGMSGRQLAERLIPLRQAMKVLYMSGYTDDALVRHGVFEADIAFLQKPFSPDHLAGKVREVLDMPEGK
jgi:two-component system cell cycle sensor histidine kinase/response regulator CckA